MKHIFFIHSHITFFVSKQFVYDYNINPADCLFICARDYVLPSEYSNIFKNIIDYPTGIFPDKNFTILPTLNFIRGYRNIHVLDVVIKQFTKNDLFILYTLNTGAHLISAIVTMRQCNGYYLIEEGTSAYTNLKQLPRLYHKLSHRIIFFFLRPFFPRLFLLKDNVFSCSTKYYLGTIATSKLAFLHFPKQKIVVSNPFCTITLPIKPDIVLSVDGLLLQYNIPLHIVEKIYLQILNIIKQENKTIVAYKFHPLFYNNHDLIISYRKLIMNIFGDSSYELPSNIAIENVLNTYHSDFYSDCSSVAIYAANFGVKCYSYAKVLTKLFPESTYSDEVFTNLPQILLESYIFI